MKPITTAKWSNRLVAFLLISTLILIHVQLHQYAFDDAFIHFRIARNFLETATPYYNANEAVKVSTSSGWTIFLTILLGIARLLHINGNFPLIISIINAIITFSGMLVYTKTLERLWKHPIRLSTKLLFQIPLLVLLLPSSIGLMETPLALLLAGLGIYFLTSSKPVGLGFIGIAVYVRVELTILLLLVSFVLFIRKQFKAKHIIGLGLGITPFLFYDLWYFKTIIPHSIIAKSTVYSLTALQSAMYILFLSFPTISSSGYGLAASSLLFLSTLAITTNLVIQGWRRRDNNTWHRVFYLWGTCTIAAYILGHSQVFDWYKAIYTIPLFVSSFLFIKDPRNVAGKVIHYVIFILFAISLITTIYASIYNPSAFGYFMGGSRVKVYLHIGEVLHDEYPDARLLTSEIGGLGYSFEGRIIDAAGLASPDALEFHPMKVPEERANSDIGAIPPNYVKATMPELIVSYDHFAHALMMDEIIQHYNVTRIPAYLPEDAVYSQSKTIWDSKYLRVYIRRDLPLSERILMEGE